MDFDPKLFEDIKNMDQKELDKKIKEISAILKVDPRLVKRLVGDPQQLQQKLSNLSENDIQRLAKRMDPKTIELIKQTFE